MLLSAAADFGQAIFDSGGSASPAGSPDLQAAQEPDKGLLDTSWSVRTASTLSPIAEADAEARGSSAAAAGSQQGTLSRPVPAQAAPAAPPAPTEAASEAVPSQPEPAQPSSPAPEGQQAAPAQPSSEATGRHQASPPQQPATATGSATALLQPGLTLLAKQALPGAAERAAVPAPASARASSARHQQPVPASVCTPPPGSRQPWQPRAPDGWDLQYGCLVKGSRPGGSAEGSPRFPCGGENSSYASNFARCGWSAGPEAHRASQDSGSSRFVAAAAAAAAMEAGPAAHEAGREAGGSRQGRHRSSSWPGLLAPDRTAASAAMLPVLPRRQDGQSVFVQDITVGMVFTDFFPWSSSRRHGRSSAHSRGSAEHGSGPQKADDEASSSSLDAAPSQPRQADAASAPQQQQPGSTAAFSAQAHSRQAADADASPLLDSPHAAADQQVDDSGEPLPAKDKLTCSAALNAATNVEIQLCVVRSRHKLPALTLCT